MAWRPSPPARRVPGYVAPCIPTLGREVPDGPAWIHEIKHDGYRFICRRDGERVRAFTRRGYDWTDRVPRIAAALRELRASSATIDGEAVVCDSAGLAQFDRLRTALGGRTSETFLYAFDLLELDGEDLRARPWEVRRAALTKLLRRAGDGILLCEHLEGGGASIYRHACRLGLEGIVSKRRDRPYRSGRSPDWIKVKNPDAPAATRLLE